MMGTHKNGMQWDGGEKYNVIKFIGEGAFAKVLQVSTKRDGEIFAAKQLEKRRFVKDGHLGSKVYFELNVMKNLSHVIVPA